MNVSCDRYRDMLTAYLDGELSLRDRADVEKHLENCPACAKLAAGMERSLEAMKLVNGAQDDFELPPGLPEKIAAKVVDERYSKSPVARRLAAAMGVAALITGLAAGYALRPYLSGQRTDGDNIMVSAVSFKSESMGVEIDKDTFILHTRNKNGGKGIDLKF